MASRAPLVLIIDDSPRDIELLQAAFAEADVPARFAVATNGDDGIARLCSRRPGAECPDLVMLDIGMPKLDGRAFLGFLRTNPPVRQVPVIILTGNQDDTVRDACIALGVDAFLRKPPEFDALVELVRGLRPMLIKVSSARLKAQAI